MSIWGILSLRPIVASAGMSKDEVVRTEKGTEGSRFDSIHRPRFEIDKDCSRNILSTRGLERQDWTQEKTYFIEIDVQAFFLNISFPMVSARDELVLSRKTLKKSGKGEHTHQTHQG